MKKLYRSTFLQLIFALCIFGFSACQEYSIDSQPVGPLKVQVDALETYTVVSTSPENIIFNVSANTPWTIESSGQWCKVDPAMSSASSLVAAVTVSFEDNNSAEERTATLTIKADGVTDSKVITITQPSINDLQVPNYTEMVSADGEEIEVKFMSNKAWSVVSSDQFLSNIDKLSGEGKKGEWQIVKIKVPTNPAAKRMADLTFRTASQEKTITITQGGISIVPEDGVTEIEATGLIEQKEIKISANAAWKATVPDEYKDWISVEEDVDNSLLTVSMKANPYFISRVGKVMLGMKNPVAGFEETVLNINQSIAFTLPTDETTYTIDEVGGSMKVTGKSDVFAKFNVKKGHLTFNFKEIKLTGTGHMMLNMTAKAPGTGNYKYNISEKGDNKFYLAGEFGWQAAAPVALTADQIGQIRKIEFYVENDPNTAGKLRIRLLIDEKEKGVGNGKVNVFDDPALAAKYKDGIPVQIAFDNVPADNSYTIASVVYEPYE